MAKIQLSAFSGEQPRVLPRLMPNNAAQSAVNCRLDDGSLTPIRQASLIHTMVGMPEAGYRTIYRHGTTWLGWLTLVHAAPGPVAQDRLYYTGDGAPKMRVLDTIYPLAIPRPAAALTATVSGTATDPTIVSSRTYVYTYVTSLGEETEPAEASEIVDWSPGQTVTLSGFGAVPAGRAIDRQRIYRSQTGTSGTDLYFIAERTASASDFVDTIDVDDFAEVLPSKAYNAPPDGLSGLIPLPNGMMAAFTGRDIYFSEPYQPHAWPEKYVLTTEVDIVALGAFDSSVLVMTKGTPYLITGNSPDTMVMQRLEENRPCLGAAGVVDLGYGIAYPSHDGIVLARSGGIALVTGNIFAPAEWGRMNPSTMVAGQLSGRYIATFNGIDADGNALAQTIAIDLSSAAFLIRFDSRARAHFYDIGEGALYFLDAESADIMRFDPPDGDRANAFWHSKQFVIPYPENFGVILIEVENGLTQAEIDAREQEIADIIAANAAMLVDGSLAGALGAGVVNATSLDGDLLTPLPRDEGSSTQVSIYGDGILRDSVSAINRVKRLRAGTRARKWEIAISTGLIVEQVTMASTVDELKTPT